MNRIIKGHLDSFVKSHGLDTDDESVQFEKFVNFSILTPKVASSFDLENVTTSTGDDGMDGVAIIIDEDVIVSDKLASAG